MNAGQGALERYLKQLRAELKARGVHDAGDLADEVTSHVRETVGADSDEGSVGLALEAFGEPAALAASVAAERYAGSLADGPKHAATWRRVVSWMLDGVWVLAVPGVLLWASLLWWQTLLMFAVEDASALLPLLVTPGPAFAVPLTLMAVAWLAITGRATWRAMRARRATRGMTAAGLAYASSADGGTIVSRVADAVAAGSPPPKNRGRAVLGLAAIVALLAIAAVWEPLFWSLESYMPTESNTGYNEAQSMVEWAYQTVLDQDPESRAEMTRYFSDSNMTFDEFVSRYESDGVIGSMDGGGGYRGADTPDIPVSHPDSASVEVVRVETGVAEDGSRTSRQVFFSFRLLDKVPAEGGAPRPTWRLVRVVRDPLGKAGGSGPTAAEVRDDLSVFLSDLMLSADERSTPTRGLMTESFAASPAAAPLLPGTTEAMARSPRWTIDSIAFDGAVAVAETTEGWTSAGADPMKGEKRRYAYRLVRVRDDVLVDGRERIE